MSLLNIVFVCPCLFRLQYLCIFKCIDTSDLEAYHPLRIQTVPKLQNALGRNQLMVLSGCFGGGAAGLTV